MNACTQSWETEMMLIQVIVPFVLFETAYFDCYIQRISFSFLIEEEQSNIQDSLLPFEIPNTKK